MRRRTIAWFALLLFVACGPLPVGAAQTPAPDAVYRSEELFLEVALPEDWAVVEEPWTISASFTGVLAFNSWGEAGYRPPGMDRDNVLVYRPKWVRRTLPWYGALITLAEVRDGGALWQAENYGPEWQRQDLSGLWLSGDCRQRQGITQLRFQKWGRSLLLEVLCPPEAPDETARAVERLLASWRFDVEPAGDAGRAVLRARDLMPWAAFPQRFPLLQGRLTSAEPVRSAWTHDGVLRSSTARLEGEVVAVTFEVQHAVAGSRAQRGPGRCPGRRGGTMAHRWRIEVGPEGRAVLAGEGGAPLPARKVRTEEQAGACPARPLALYLDPAMGFSLHYPADWQQLEFTRRGGAPTATFVDGDPPPGTMYRDRVEVQVHPSPSTGVNGNQAYSSTLSFLSHESPGARDELLAACPADAPVRSFALYRTPAGAAVLAAVHGGWGYQIWLYGHGAPWKDSPAAVMLCSLEFLPAP